jgi:hypothetical protein
MLREALFLVELAYGVIWLSVPSERSEEGVFIGCVMGWAGLDTLIADPK